MAGEYGEKFGRPHFHACLFGHDFQDKVTLGKSQTGFQLYRSPTLEKLWPYGYSSIGHVTFESAAYIARYIMKKQTGDKAKKHYERITENGEIIKIKPEFNQMSRKPGIAKAWLEKYTADVYPNGKVVRPGGATMNAPRFYDKHYKKRFPSEYEQLKLARELEAINAPFAEKTQRRLDIKAVVEEARINFLQRKID